MTRTRGASWSVRASPSLLCASPIAKRAHSPPHLACVAPPCCTPGPPVTHPSPDHAVRRLHLHRQGGGVGPRKEHRGAQDVAAQEQGADVSVEERGAAVGLLGQGLKAMRVPLCSSVCLGRGAGCADAYALGSCTTLGSTGNTPYARVQGRATTVRPATCHMTHGTCGVPL